MMKILKVLIRKIVPVKKKTDQKKKALDMVASAGGRGPNRMWRTHVVH